MAEATAEDRFTPTWDLVINGSIFLPARHRSLIKSITVTSSIDGADTLEIEAEGLDTLDNCFRFCGETILAVGNVVSVLLGYTGVPLFALQRFEITGEKGAYRSDGMGVRIKGISAAHDLVDEVKARKYPSPSTDSDIARQIAEEHGFLVTADSVEDTPARQKSRIKPQGTTDLKFLQQLAQANGYGPPYVRYDVGKQADVLYFRTTSLANQAKIATFVWRAPWIQSGSPSTCFSFDPDLDVAGLPSSVQVTGWDTLAQEPIRVTVEIGKEGQKTTVQKGKEVKNYPATIKSGAQLVVAVLDTSTKADKTAKVETLSHTTIDTTEDALSWATRWIDTRNRAFMTAKAKVIGWEELWIDQAHRFDGLAPTHVGLWEVHECVHRIGDSAYTCDLELGRVLEEAATPQEV